MGIYSAVALALAAPIAGVIGNHAREMYRDRKYRELFGSLFWAIFPFVIFSVVWVANENPATMGRNLFLGAIGAAVGACGLIWLGYLVNDKTAPEPQQVVNQLALRDPDGIYQFNEKVGTVFGADVDRSSGEIRFQQIRDAINFDTNTDFEYRNYIVHFEGASAIASVGGLAMAPNKAYADVKSRIVSIINP
jgi:hypothetical protein